MSWPMANLLLKSLKKNPIGWPAQGVTCEILDSLWLVHTTDEQRAAPPGGPECPVWVCVHTSLNERVQHSGSARPH